jgi:hypothetical protein
MNVYIYVCICRDIAPNWSCQGARPLENRTCACIYIYIEKVKRERNRKKEMRMMRVIDDVQTLSGGYEFFAFLFPTVLLLLFCSSKT